MYEIPMERASEEFAGCWQAAGAHLQRQAQGPIRMWLKANLFPPFLEHLSFCPGNQLFFVRVEDADSRLEVPGNRDLLTTVAEDDAFDLTGQIPATPLWRGHQMRIR
jgi:hypothetical protein